MSVTTSSEPSRSRSSSPWHILSNVLKTLSSWRSLMSVSSPVIMRAINYTNLGVKDSGGLSSARRVRPFMMSDLTFAKAKTVRPKCRPLWTRGSLVTLMGDKGVKAGNLTKFTKELTDASEHLAVKLLHRRLLFEGVARG